MSQVPIAITSLYQPFGIHPGVAFPCTTAAEIEKFGEI